MSSDQHGHESSPGTVGSRNHVKRATTIYAEKWTKEDLACKPEVDIKKLKEKVAHSSSSGKGKQKQSQLTGDRHILAIGNIVTEPKGDKKI